MVVTTTTAPSVFDSCKHQFEHKPRKRFKSCGVFRTGKMYTGKELITTFQNLGINTGNVNKLTINSWFDTDDKAILDVLNFIGANFTKENVLTALEQEEYEDLLENKNVLYDEEYENCLKEIEDDFVGILDWQTNELDIENMKHELALLAEEENDLESLIEMNRTVTKTITKTVNQTLKDTANWELRRKNAERKCVELGENLDNVHSKLHQQIHCYAAQLNKFENPTCLTFLSNVPTKKYEQYVTEIKSCFNVMGNDTTITSTISHLQNSYVSELADKLEMLRERIFASKKCLLDKQIELDHLKAEIQFMETLNIDRLLLLSYNDNGSQVNFEASTFTVQVKWEHFAIIAEDSLRKFADMMIDKPKINVIQNGIDNDRKRLQRLNLLNEIITKICSLQKLYYTLLEKENADINATDTFFKEIYLYITKNLVERESCIKSMVHLTDEYHIYKNIPVQKKFKIFSLLEQLYLGQEQNEDLLISVIRNYWYETDNAILKMITHESNRTQKLSQQLLPQIDILQKFLTTGPTSQISIIPYEVYEYLDKIAEAVEMQGKTLPTAILSLKNAKKQLANNKWFKLRRQLWIWFIVDPKKVLQIIDEVQAALKSARKFDT